MPDPIVQRKPETEQAVLNKYRRNPGLLADAPSPISNALLALDIERSGKGQNPLSVRQSQLALQAALTNTAQTRPPDQGFWGDLVGNIRTLTSAIPRLPAALFQEVKSLPQAPAAIQEALGAGGPGDILQELSQAPGVRMLPGAFVAGNLINSPEELVNNPLFAALDILPAGKTPGVRRAVNTAVDRARPAINPVLGAVGRTRPGQFARETFGTTARDVSQVEAELSNRLRTQLDPEGLPDPDPMVNLARRATGLRQKYPNIAEDRRTELTRLMTEDADAIRTLPPEELAFVNETRGIVDELGNVGVNEGLLQRIDGELYDPQTAKKILRSRRKAQTTQDFADIRDTILNPTDDVEFYRLKMLDVLKRDDLKTGGKLKMIEGLAFGADAANFEARELFDAIRAARNPKKQVDIETVIRDWDPVQYAPFTTTEIIDTLTPLARTDPMAARLLDAVKGNRWKDARTLAKRASRRTRYPIPNIDQMVEAAYSTARRQRYLQSTARFNEKAAVKAQARADRILGRNPPARYQPRIEREINERITTQLSDHPDFDAILPYLRERNYGWLNREGLITESEFRAIQNEVKSSWQAMKEGGYDPVFVHRVSPTQLSQIQYPRVLESVRKPSQVRARTNDISPAIDDVSIAVSHQAMEWLARQGSEEFIDQILTRWGRTEGDLVQQYIPAARIRAQYDKKLDVLGHANEMMRREWEPYDPAKIITWPSPRIKRWNDEQPWVPKTVANTVQRMHSPPTGRLTAILDPIMKVFRTSLLPLSPRWHFYNILGGGIVLTARTGPSVWKYTKLARDMVKRGDMPEGLPHGLGTVPHDIIEWNARAGIQDKLTAVYHYKGGQTLKRLWDSSTKARDVAGKVIQKSYDWNGMVDDMYRTMAYLYGHDKTITKGLTKDAAEKAGVELSRKVMQNWDRMTPIERTIMRYVFPFYGWMSHIIKYSLTYPFDHPYRTAVMGAFARNEMEDMGDALPERFLNMFFLGQPDKDGNVNSINLAGMNPFGDVANYFTIAGFMGQLNPVISATLESIGIDPAGGGPELFPNLRYDPNIGRLTADSGNPLTNFIQATLPQSRILFGFADSGSEFQELVRQNPDAAARLLRSQAGLPVIFRDVNVPQEIAKAEIARDEGQSTALNEALKSGHWEGAEKWPNLRPILDQIATLQGQGSLDQFTPQSEGQANIALAQEALLRMNTP